MKPPIAPNSTPVKALGFNLMRSKRVLSQWRRTNAAAIRPMASRIWAELSEAANNAPRTIPVAMPGSMTFRFQPLQVWR